MVYTLITDPARRNQPPRRGPQLAVAALLLLALTAPAAFAQGSMPKTQAAAAPSAAAAELGEGSDPEFIQVGQARLKVLLWSIYDSRLYTPTGEYEDGQRPLRLEIQYLRDIKAKALVERTQVEWEAMGRDHPRQGQWLARLGDIWPDISASDVLTLEIDTQNIASFSHNGQLSGRIEDPEFGQQFVDIWLSRDCTRPELRESLLGLTGP